MLPILAQQALGADPDDDDEIGPGLAIDETTDLKRAGPPPASHRSIRG